MTRGAQLDLVGLVPAAGKAKRISPLPCSKEIYPIGFRRDKESGDIRVEVVSHQLFEKFRRAGAQRAFVILRDGKWDIPSYFGEGQIVGLSLAYLVIADSIGPCDTLDRAYPFVNNETVMFGFPDILFHPDDAFQRLLVRLNESRADIVLGLFPEVESRKTDMVDIEDSGRIRSLAINPPSSTLKYTWACAVWRPAFTEFMHSFLLAERAESKPHNLGESGRRSQPDLPVGIVVKRAIENGMNAHGVVLAEESYVDIGTPDNLIAVARKAYL
jgi:dTDP-glucose pyrophosphorylase